MIVWNGFKDFLESIVNRVAVRSTLVRAMNADHSEQQDDWLTEKRVLQATIHEQALGEALKDSEIRTLRDQLFKAQNNVRRPVNGWEALDTFNKQQDDFRKAFEKFQPTYLSSVAAINQTIAKSIFEFPHIRSALGKDA